VLSSYLKGGFVNVSNSIYNAEGVAKVITSSENENNNRRILRLEKLNTPMDMMV
jgi:hypothetical protein